MSDIDIKKLTAFDAKHDDEYKCSHCGGDMMSQRGEPAYHNHEPYGRVMEEILECMDCCKYTQALWQIKSVNKLEVQTK